MVIGYGFRDDHVNELLADAIAAHGLRLYVICPESAEQFQGRVAECHLGEQIWGGLYGFYPKRLAEVFPHNHYSDTEAFASIKREFFGL